MRDKMDINNFNIFGEESSEETNISPPEIKQNHPFTMTALEVESMLERVKRLSERAVSCLVSGRNLEKNNVEKFSWAMYLMEQAMIDIRKLANEFENEENSNYKGIDFNEYLATVDINKDIVSLDLPLLVPKRIASQHTNYYCNKLDDLLKDKKIPESLKNQKVAIVFLHCYEKSHAKWAKRDHDNLEIKWIIDALNNHFFIDDGPFRTSLYNHSTVDIRDHTVIYLMPIIEFPDFISEKIPIWEKAVFEL